MKKYGYVILIGLCCFFGNLGSAALFEEDEPKNAECGREMFVRGDWLVPTFNEELRTDKPILLYWLMLCSFHLLGMHEFAARVPSAFLSTGTIMLVCLLANRLFKHRSGILAALILATSIMFTIIARASTPDGTLIFLITLTLTLESAKIVSVANYAQIQPNHWKLNISRSKHPIAINSQQISPV